MNVSLYNRSRIQHRRTIGLVLAGFLTIALIAGYFIYRQYQLSAWHFARLREYWEDPEHHQDWALQSGERCGDAPFLSPTDGFVAFFYGDRYRNGRLHQGVDIFGPTGPNGLGQTPVVAAYNGYLTRMPDWHASVILRIPDDPLHPGRQIWLYYTHMADSEGHSFILSEFPAGTFEKFIPAGTLLGHQGNYSADPLNPTGMHLHFSIVLDDSNGSFRNELEFINTVDPSPYLGIELNAAHIGKQIAHCTKTLD